MLEDPIIPRPLLSTLPSDLSSDLCALFVVQDELPDTQSRPTLDNVPSNLFAAREVEPSNTPNCPAPGIREGSPKTGQAPETDVEEDEPELQPSSPVPSRPSSPMSMDDDGARQDSPLQDVAEKDSEDLSHLGNLHLQGHMSHTVRRIWPDLPSEEDPIEPGSHVPSTNPWPTVSFTAVKEAWSNPWDNTGLAGFPLPSGRPTPIPRPATIPDRYTFSSPSSRVSLCEPSDLGLVYRR